MTPIAAPRYIIFIIPIILIFIIRSSINLKIKFLIFIFVATINISVNYDNRNVQKPHTVQALDLIKEKSSNSILVLPKVFYFKTTFQQFQNKIF